VGRALRTTLDAALGEDLLQVAVEADGWASMLQFVALGLGVAVVNGCCRLPRGVVARPITDLPRLQYRVVSVAGGLHSPAQALVRLVVEHRDDWRRASRTAQPTRAR
jgi:DNA-binding transcriptional LysR family regulator